MNILRSTVHGSLIAMLTSIMLLSGCSHKPTNAPLTDHMQNPLYAEAYAEEVVDRLVEFYIRKDDILEDAKKKATIDSTKDTWKEKAADARAKQREGTSGFMIPITEFAEGEVLLREDTLYMGPFFRADPTPFLHVFMTTTVDPRNPENFPDITSIDLGPLQSAFGAHSYSVPPAVEQAEDRRLRTVVLYDIELERIHAFAQLR